MPSAGRYDATTTAWARTAFVCGVLMLWDEEFFDRETQRFEVERYLDLFEADFGRADALVLWHAYPRIGFDDRNQFDFYRDIPGGVSALRDIIERLHARGTRAILDYNPWDTGTRAEPSGDEAALAELVVEVAADGIFLDTLADASASLLAAIDRAGAEVILQSEHVAPLSGLHDHLMSWAQWPERLNERLLLRNKWAKPRQMQHLVRRWHEDHADELFTAWLNGSGVVVWENVFGSWFPWNPTDKATLRSMRSVHSAYGEWFASGDWTPYVQTSSAAVDASEWTLGDISVWAFVNRSDAEVHETLVLHGQDGDVLTAPLGGVRRAAGTTTVVLGPKSIGFVAQVGSSSPGVEVARHSSTVRRVRDPLPPIGRRSSADPAPADMVTVASGIAGPARFRLRECGAYDRAPLVGRSYPDLTGDIAVLRDRPTRPIVIDPAAVTNDEYLDFLSATAYVPAHRERFLDHWIADAPAPGTGGDPVVYVDLDDARAYAGWRGCRLPTEDEWQLALATPGVGYGARRVWEWTESEQSDGHSRFVVLKGGSDRSVAGSDWYAESGPLLPERSAKFVLFAPSIDRSSTVGFRCAADLDAVGPDQLDY
ncbi:formylglycine-generating enzyme family protein [uncultured Amnibacterium sp.]|uniref:formylglycine-generating enzyme family protein n=1 Tax=uncultured Amnibacterium sp. TaxID=1631851 RepID=UPI0035C98BD1